MDAIRDGYDWCRSSYCTGADATCVEVAIQDANVLLRDSKDPRGPVLRFSREEWLAFLRGAAAGEFS